MAGKPGLAIPGESRAVHSAAHSLGRGAALLSHLLLYHISFWGDIVAPFYGSISLTWVPFFVILEWQGRLSGKEGKWL